MKIVLQKMSKASLQKILVWLAILAYFSVFSYLSCLRHAGLKTTMNNLGNMVQPIYNSAHGSFMYSSNFIVGAHDTSRFAIHANFIFILLIPIYWLLPEPMVLLVLQTALIALGALPLYWLGKKIFGAKSWLALIGPYIYLVSPAVHDVNLYDFHAISLAMPLIMFAFYFLYIKKYFWFAIFALGIILTKEDASLIVAAMGMYILLVQKQRRIGLTTFLGAIIYFVIVNQLVMPYFSGGTSNVFITQRYSHLGNSPVDIVLKSIRNPMLLLQSLISATKLWYMMLLLMPVFFLSIVRIDILSLSLPSLLINLLSTEEFTMHYPFGYYYSAPILPFIFFSTIFALFTIKRRLSPAIFKMCVFLIFVSSGIYSIVFSPAPYSVIARLENFSVSDNAKEISYIKSLIPQDASLTIQNNLGPHFAHRKHIYTFPFTTGETQYILIDVFDQYSHPQFGVRPMTFPILAHMTFQQYYDRVSDLFSNTDFGVIYASSDGYILFKKNISREENEAAKEIFLNNLRQMHEKNYSIFPLSLN